MANAIYPKYKQALLSGGSNTDMSAGPVTLTASLFVNYDTF